MSPRKKAIKALKDSGYNLKREGANHDIYYNSQTKVTIPLKRGHFNDNDLNYILKEIDQGNRH